jgi:hypothetical protein
MIGADRVVATRMVVADGRFTGEIEFYAYGEGKATAVYEMAAAEGYDLTRCYAYSDSVTDVPMLSAVGHPYVVNPDRALRREALARGWPVLVFSRPVQLGERFGVGMPSRPLLTAALSAGAATVGFLWYAARRQVRNRLAGDDG